jgi:hypothetical protein
MIGFFISGGLLNCRQVVVLKVLIESENGNRNFICNWITIMVCNEITPFSFQNFRMWFVIQLSSKLFQHHMKALLIFNNTKNW